MSITAKELDLATQHPRGTEQRTLGPYRTALNDLAAYAGLAVRDRDVIVRWAETRRRVRDGSGVDKDPLNLADPLIPAATLRALVLAGERQAGGRALDDDGGDLIALVARMRSG